MVNIYINVYIIDYNLKYISIMIIIKYVSIWNITIFYEIIKLTVDGEIELRSLFLLTLSSTGSESLLSKSPVKLFVSSNFSIADFTSIYFDVLLLIL